MLAWWATRLDCRLFVYQHTCIHCVSHLNRTIATASFITLSPNTKAYRSTSTCISWKMASTVTVNKIKMKQSRLFSYVHILKVQFVPRQKQAATNKSMPHGKCYTPNETYLGLLLILKLRTKGIPENQNSCLLEQTWCRHTLSPYSIYIKIICWLT